MSRKIFDCGLVAAHTNKVTLMLNKPAYIGMCILELSKVLLYEFHYDYIMIALIKHIDRFNRTKFSQIMKWQI